MEESNVQRVDSPVTVSTGNLDFKNVQNLLMHGFNYHAIIL